MKFTEMEAKERFISVELSTDSFENKSHKNSYQSYSASPLLTHISRQACSFCKIANYSSSESVKATFESKF